MNCIHRSPILQTPPSTTTIIQAQFKSHPSGARCPYLWLLWRKVSSKNTSRSVNHPTNCPQVGIRSQFQSSTNFLFCNPCQVIGDSSNRAIDHPQISRSPADSAQKRGTTVINVAGLSPVVPFWPKAASLLRSGVIPWGASWKLQQPKKKKEKTTRKHRLEIT